MKDCAECFHELAPGAGECEACGTPVVIIPLTDEGGWEEFPLDLPVP